MGRTTEKRKGFYTKYKIVKTSSKYLNHFIDNKELSLNEKFYSVLF